MVSSRCTGTLLTPTVVLTAGHCTEDEQGDANLVTWVRNDPVIDVAAELPNYPSVQAWLQDLWVAATAIAHPSFDSFSQFPNTYDVGVVLMDEPIEVAESGDPPMLNQFAYLRTTKGPPSRRQAVVLG